MYVRVDIYNDLCNIQVIQVIRDDYSPRLF